MPPWICGTRVLTRPSKISGKPECSDTSLTTTPASRSALADPPVERISTPWAASACANGTKPDLSETEISARRMGTMSIMRRGITLQPQQVQRAREHFAFVVALKRTLTSSCAHARAQRRVSCQALQRGCKRWRIAGRHQQASDFCQHLFGRPADVGCDHG